MFEYFGAYDDGRIKTRLRALQVGGMIFSRMGKAAYEFVEFHKNKHRVLGDVLKYLYVILGLGGFVLLLYVFSAPFFFALLAFVPPIITHLLTCKPRLNKIYGTLHIFLKIVSDLHNSSICQSMMRMDSERSSNR